MSGTTVERAPSVPVVRPGVETEEERMRTRQQHSVYRRLFMDIEREQVKENIRQRNHRLRMAAYVTWIFTGLAVILAWPPTSSSLK